MENRLSEVNELKRPRQQALGWCVLCSQQLYRKPGLSADNIVMGVRVNLHSDQLRFTGRTSAEPVGKP
jgi:hypothetical protein